jgi:mono/diheme cytochrome c family protein
MTIGGWKRAWIAAWALGATAVLAQAVPGSAVSRGELLYATHCTGCHTAQVHWRDKKLATDWASLRSQVNRWQTNTGLAWSNEEVADVTRYLNTRYYHFRSPRRQVDAAPPTLGSARLLR